MIMRKLEEEIILQNWERVLLEPLGELERKKVDKNLRLKLYKKNSFLL